MENSKRTVKKIPHTDNYTLIRAIVIGIAYREKIKERHKMHRRPTNKHLQAEVYRAEVACNMTNRKCEISDMAESSNKTVLAELRGGEVLNFPM